MEPEFWAQRWQQGRIGFHLPRVNDALERHVDALGLGAGDSVLVPLCGKSLDMLWLAGRDCRVLGVELIEIAVRAFFEENDLDCERERRGALTAYRSGNIGILCGDIFDVGRDALADVRAVYDRAALIALPEPMRTRYVDHLFATLPSAWRMLMMTLEYDESSRGGPPFSVGETEVRRLFGTRAEVELLERRGSSRSSDSEDVREAIWSIDVVGKR
jgi:thiopurine S-methyltransferase